MDTVAFLKMDIFFVVTTIVVMFFGILGVVLLFYVIKIMKEVSEIVHTVKQETEDVAKDFREIRKDIKSEVHEVRVGVSSATHFTKTIAGAGIVRALSSLFEAFVEEKENVRIKRKVKRGK